jgi:hypothetical protein
MDEPVRTFANLEITCSRSRRASFPREASTSLDLYMNRNKQPKQQLEQEEISFVFPSFIHKSSPSSDDTLTTCNASMSTFQSMASGSTAGTASTTNGPLHQQEDNTRPAAPQTIRRIPSIEPSRRRIVNPVRFLLDDDGNVVCAYLPSEGPLTDEEKQAVWWQPLEFKLFRRYCKKAAQIARNSEYAEHFTKVYDACSQKHITDVREHCHIARSHARGLEVVVFPTLVQARKLVVKGVIKTQEKLPASMDADQRAKVLSATSRCLTGRSRLLSRVFAVGDEEIAKDCYYSMG